jgi:hypothetical protein
MMNKIKYKTAFAKPMYIYFSMLFLFLGSNDTNQGLHHSGKFYWRRTPEYPEKTTNLPHVTVKLYPVWRGFI